MDGIGCRIELLGELRIVHGERIITRFRTQKAAGVIAYLALFLRQIHTREAIADLFWPDKDPEAGRQNLTTTLTSIRRQLEAIGLSSQAVLLSDHHTVRLNPACVSTDVDAFDRLFASVAQERDPAKQARTLEAMIALYRSTPLPDRYEEWAIDLQHRCGERYADALEQLSVALEEMGRAEAASEVARRAVQTDPYRETPRFVLMRTYASLGRTAAALESYGQYERLLREEMGVSPSTVMQALAERLRQDPDAFTKSLQTAASPLIPVPKSENAPAVSSNLSPMGEEPAASSLKAVFPLQLTRYFGREAELERLERLLSPGSIRLLTIIGPGGAGKTRLSVEIARRIEAAYQGRVWFVDLSALPGPELLPITILNALKLPLGRAVADHLQAIETALHGFSCLLILDNFEHLLRRGPSEPGKGSVPGCTEYIRLLLERVPGLTCLVTSRQPLHLGGEQEFPLPPLAMPGKGEDAPESLVQKASIALFVDRAILAKPDFALTRSNAGTIAALCRRLEGMPLAIEMAAAWVKSLPPTQILERMERQLDLLVSRRRDLPVRHQSLRATIEWSYELLNAQQQQGLLCLSVFQGGWSLEAATAVCESDEVSILELLTELQECSLVEVTQQGDRTRYRLPDTVCEFCRERTEVTGKRSELQQKHRDYYLKLAEESEFMVSSAGQVHLIPRLEEEHDNLRAAIRFCITDPLSSEQGLRFPVAMHHFWEVRGYLEEGLQLCLALLQHPGAQARTEGRSYVLQTCFWMAFYQSDYARGLMWIEEALAIAREVGSPASLGHILNAMGAALMTQQEYRRAQDCFEETLLIWKEAGDLAKTCRALHNLGRALWEQGENVKARALFEECLILNRQIGDRGGVAATLHFLSWMDYGQGDLVSARRRAEEALRLNQEIGNKTWALFTLANLAWIALSEGKTEEALSLCRNCLELLNEVSSKKDLASTLECLAELAHAHRNWERAGILWGAAESLRAAIGRTETKRDPALHTAKVAEARTALGEETFRRAWERGAGMTTEQMLLHAK